MSSSEGSLCSSTPAPYQFEPQLRDAEEAIVFNLVDEECAVSESYDLY